MTIDKIVGQYDRISHECHAYNRGFGASLARAGLAIINMYLSIARPADSPN